MTYHTSPGKEPLLPYDVHDVTEQLAVWSKIGANLWELYCHTLLLVRM